MFFVVKNSHLYCRTWWFTSTNGWLQSGILASARVCVAQVAEPPCSTHSGRCLGLGGMSFEGFLGCSPRAYGAPWEHIWAQPEIVWPPKTAPAISPWLWLACPLIRPSMNDSFQQPPPHSSHCVYPALSSKCPLQHSLFLSLSLSLTMFQPSGIICLSATWQRPTRFVAGQTFN